MKTIEEGKTKIYVELQKVVDKKMPSFYNPIMNLNRDFTLLVINALNKNQLDIADPLAGTGIRTLRILNELNNEKINKIYVNDIKPDFKETLEKNITLNENINKNKLEITNTDANKILNNNYFDYVEIDPFGTPNPYLDSAIRNLRRDAILSVTATDTSALCGSYPTACIRKYWAKPLRDETMHEFGLRILIRKIQLIGAQHEKALIPIVSFSQDHYMKIFFKIIKNKTKVDEILKKHETHTKNKQEYGPIWTGQLNEKTFLETMQNQSKELTLNKKTIKLLNQLIQENQQEHFLYHDIHTLSSELNLKTIPKHEKIIEELTKKGYNATKTHFSDTSIKTNAKKQEIKKILKKIIKN